ncbi:hypothetical protein TRFO_24054 [Tritrichomonas foetus]|uniref:DUF3447 domain-containing protein n=1 Tax=Tritrichomonas foetus TaxID=1144522 RepID=A0A1J4K8H1_9EUKA|nr:hypothetical protein TRFO_24054 [Tritrichomonas foetus]|eukprot:OHT07703.1 hypothetical protein TRFO_24054 [Tritrichomonas foetus]
MELNGISKLRKDLKILQNLQRKMISILSWNESPISTSNQIKDLFNFFEEISISQHFSHYEAFLRIFVHLSIYFDFQKTKEEEIISQRQEIFFIVLKELIVNHSLKTSFDQLTLFLIFEQNKHFLLFLFEEELFDISFLIQKITSLYDKNLFIFFIPEIKKLKPEFYDILKEKFYLTEDDINTFYKLSNEKSQEESSTIKQEQDQHQEKENTFEIQRKIHSEEEIAKIIRTDDIHHFIDFISKIEFFDLNCKIEPSFLENNLDINNLDINTYMNKGISLIEYSMAFGSINIFRYLLKNKAQYSEESLKYCIIGNHYEILHHLEEESKFEFDEKIYHKSIEYYHPEFIEYFSNSNILNEKKVLTISLIIKIFHETTNIEILFELFFNKEISEFSTYEEYRYFSSLSNDFISTFDINNIFFTLLESRQFPFYFLYRFFLRQPNIDINLKTKIFHFQFIIIFFFSNGIFN